MMIWINVPLWKQEDTRSKFLKKMKIFGDLKEKIKKKLKEFDVDNEKGVVERK